MDPLDESLARRALRKAAMTDRPVADREPLSPLRDVTTYDARRREVAEMIAEGDAQSDDGLMGPDGLADALMEIADGWYRSALDAAHPDEAGLQEAVLVVLEAVRPRPLGPGMDATPTLRYDSPAIGVLRAALAQPAVPVAGAERHHGSWSRSRGFEPGDPVAGAEPELQALAHEIAKEWTPHDHDPVKCPECAALRAAQPEDDGLDVRRVKQAVANVAARHGVKADPPMTVEQMAVARIFGYSTAPVTMDAEIATEYARLRVERRDGA